MPGEISAVDERAPCPHESAVNDRRLHEQAAVERGPLPASLAGRCANGYERDQGAFVHAVPYSEALESNGYAIQRALCGVKPGSRSAGWIYTGMRQVNCKRCLSKSVKQVSQ